VCYLHLVPGPDLLNCLLFNIYHMPADLLMFVFHFLFKICCLPFYYAKII
jgi:hypothetical protein